MEDDPAYARLVKEYLRIGALGPHELHTATTLAAAVEMIAHHRPDVIVADLGLPDAVGDEVVAALRDAGSHIPIVILSGQDDIHKALGSMQDGAQEFLVKGRCEDFFLGRSIRAAIARKRLEEYEQLLVGIVSHDLRAPLQAIRGAIDLLELEYGTSDLLTLAAQALHRAANLTNELLDFTKLRVHGLLPIAPQSGDLYACAQSVTEEIRIAQPDRVITLRSRGDTLLSIDIDRISQVVANLLDNALQHSPKTAPVAVMCHGADHEVTLTVTNSGTPIPAAALSRLFQPLERLDNAGSRRGSIGLGLYITDQIVRAHGGTITVTSSDADGTTFRVALPRTPTDADGPATSGAAAPPRAAD